MKKRLSAKPLLFPMPAVLIASAHAGDLGVCTVAWIGMVSGTPPTIGMGVRSSRNTLRLIEASGEFTVNIPSVGMEAIVDFCGIVSGGDVEKFSNAGLTPVRGAVVAAPLVGECLFGIECRVVDMRELGDYRLVLGEVVETQADETIVTASGNVDVGILDPLTYIPGTREYRGLGPKLADACMVGLPLKENVR